MEQPRLHVEMSMSVDEDWAQIDIEFIDSYYEFRCHRSVKIALGGEDVHKRWFFGLFQRKYRYDHL